MQKSDKQPPPSGTASTAQRLMEQFIRIKRGHWRQSPIPELTSAEFETLVSIHHLATHKAGQLGQAPSGIRPKELALHFGVAAPTVNQYTKALLEKGFIRQIPDPTDGRAVLLTLSDKGDQQRRLARQRFEALFAGLVEALGTEKMELLADLLGEVQAHIQQLMPEGNARPAGCPEPKTKEKA